jgi:cytoskeletal protein CcmA (bactofilin family)
VGPKGQAKASVRAATVEVEGEIEGDVRCDSLSLMPTARVRGTLTAKRLAVQEGALVEGSINPASTQKPDPPPAPAPAPPAPAPPPRAEAAPGETKPDFEPPK